MGKQHPCPFCDATDTQLPRHMRRKHANEPAVREILRKSRLLRGNDLDAYVRHEYKVLALEGARKHNEPLVKAGLYDNLAVVYDMEGESKSDTLECPFCGGRYRDIKRHKCVKQPQQTPAEVKALAKYSNALTILKGDKQLARLFNSMRNGEVKDLAMRDELLLSYAKHKMSKVDDVEGDGTSNMNTTHKTMDENRKDMVRAHIRMLGHYVLKFREKYKNSTIDLLDTFHPHYCQYIPRAVQKCSGQYHRVAKAKKLTSLLGKLLKFAKCQPTADLSSLVTKATFKSQVTIVNAHTRKTKTSAELNAPKRQIPEEDHAALRDGIAKRIQSLLEKRRLEFRYLDYRELCQYVIVDLASYNLKRLGEVASMSLEQYLNNEKADLLVYPANMSDEQIQRCREIVNVRIRGKSEKHQVVNVALKPLIQVAMKRIWSLHMQFDLEKNPYMFAIAGAKQSHIRGNKSFENVCKWLGLKGITAGKIRRDTSSTMALIGDARCKQLLSSILGHNMTTHTRLYKEHMAQSAAKFCHIPVMLDYIAEGKGSIEAICPSLPSVSGSGQAPPATTSEAPNRSN